MGDVYIEQNVVVCKGGERDLSVDITRPAGTSGPVPGILILPGGWNTADRTPLTDRYGISLAIQRRRI